MSLGAGGGPLWRPPIYTDSTFPAAPQQLEGKEDGGMVGAEIRAVMGAAGAGVERAAL